MQTSSDEHVDALLSVLAAVALVLVTVAGDRNPIAAAGMFVSRLGTRSDPGPDAEVGPSVPSARAGHAMEYDSESDRLILFGGEAVGDETWVYDENVNSWTRMGPPISPSARFGHGGAMVYVPTIDRIILFGGFTSDFSDDMWAYDFNTDLWSSMAPSPRPAARVGHSMAYDQGSDRVVLFGGDTGVLNNETWAYNPQSGAWMRMNPATAPSPRKGFSLVYLSSTDRILGFGGEAGGPNGETWTYDFDNDTWTRLNPTVAPSARRGHNMAYDVESERVILFSGYTEVERNDETWAYDHTTNNWTRLIPPAAPTGRVRHQMDYDIESDRILLFGGEWPPQGLANNETWAYDYNTNTWTPRIAVPSTPQGLQAAPSASGVDLTWSPPSFGGSSPILTYRVFRGTGAAPPLLAEVGPVLFYRDTNVTEGTTYYYSVSAVNGAGEGPPSTQVSAVVPVQSPGLSPLMIGSAIAGVVAAVAILIAFLLRRRRGAS